MQQKLIKVISVLLVTAILYANSAAVISYAADNFLSEQEIENQGTSTDSKNVEFDVYYDGGKHTAIADINSADTKLNVSVNVKNAGYLKDAVVDFSDTNFTIAQTEESDNIQVFDAKNKKITFNQINNGVNALESINISADKKDDVALDMFSRDNKVRLTATYVDAKANEVAIDKNIVIHTDWKAQEAKAILQYEITKYIPYATNDVSKLITQGKITSYVENSVLPIKETNIEITAPEINNKYPEKVTIIANTNATNGDAEGENFVADNWTYDSTTGKITINVKNNAVDGKIKWTKNTSDEFIVTYIYSEDVYEAVKNSAIRITYSANSKMSLYGNGISKVTATVDGYQDQTDKLGDIVEFTSEATSNISKGYLYNNKRAADENKKETEYTVKYTANVSYADIIDTLTLKQGIDQFATEEGQEKPTTVSNSNYAYNKTLKMSKQVFNNIFGTEGQINILNSKGETLDTINKDKTADDDGNIVIDLSNLNTNSITLQTSKPQKEGNITFEIIKAIAKDIDYSESQIKTFSSIKTSVVGIAKNGETDIVNNEKVNNIALDETTQKVGITISNNRLSTIVKNENIKLNVTLENDSADDTMYQNPTVKIKLPSNIEVLDVKTPQLYFDDELTIEDNKANVIENADGTKTILINIEGTQTKYNNLAARGATIEIPLDITLNKLTPTTNTVIEVSVTNGNSEATVSTNQTEVKYVAPTGVVTTNTMTGYNGDEKLETISGETQEVLIPTKAEQKELTFKMDVINNYENTLDNVVVLGRTPFAGNKDVVTSKELGSNMNVPLSSEITVNNVDSAKVTVYYSENGEATTDLAVATNKWVTTVTDYSTVKSYMIVLNDYTMNTGDAFNFSYKATIPANVDYEKSAYEHYAVFFNNNQSSGKIKDKASAVAIGVTTGTIAKLEASLTSEIPDGETVKGGTDLKYTLKVTNKGSKDATNVVASIIMPKGFVYVQDESVEKGSYDIELDENLNMTLKLKLGTIGAVSTIEKVIAFKTEATALNEDKVEIKAIVMADDDITATTNTITNTLAKTYFRTQVKTSVEDHNCIMEGYTYLYTILLKSSDAYEINEQATPEDTESAYEPITRENTVVTVTLPEELTYDSIILQQYSSELKDYEDVSSTATVSINGKTVTVNIGSLDGNYGKTLTIKSKIGTLPEGIYQKDVTTTATVQADGTEVEKIADVTDTINKPAIKITQTANIPENTVITAGEDFKYTFTIENLSDTILDNVVFTDELPEEVKFKLAEVTYPDGTKSNFKNVNEDGKPIVKMNLSKKQTATINIKVTAQSINSDTQITNKATISNENVKAESNQVTHTIKKFVNTDIEIDPGTGEEKQTKKIIGTVWIDSNKDGIKDVDEEKVSGVTVLLLDNATGDIAIDATGNKAIAKTTSAGAYMFNYLNAGKYTVIFLYDSANYSATTYQKVGVDSAKNSDAIDKDVVYEGVKRIGAVTEEIIISEENKYDIDLGLIENPKFDLKLDKVVSSITVNNSKNVQKHEYNKNLAKIDFEAKYADSSTMIVEYKFTITNEGAIPGYVKKLADYLPEELKFSTELNTDWYEGKDGTIYNSSLANTIINPGESKEVTLLLTKNMTEESFGLITNTAEIYETSNDYGLEDIDSKPGNKATNEDDISTANVLTTVKTGETIIYATLTLTIIAIIGVGTYLIKKKVIR